MNRVTYATKKQRVLLKKLGYLNWDTKRLTANEASRIIQMYLQEKVQQQIKDANKSYERINKKYTETFAKMHQLPSDAQRKSLRRLGYSYWDSPYLTYKEAQEWCEKLWKQHDLN